MKLLLGLIAGSALALASSAQAMPIHLSAVLNAANQNPPNSSTGTGMADVWIDWATNMMRVKVTFSGLSAADTAAHIHCCILPPGNTGVATQVPLFPGFPTGVTSGSYDQTFDMTQLSSYNPTFVTATGGTAFSAETVLFDGLMSGWAYLNIHTAAFPGGEIRGFLAPAPEPATLALLGAGLAGAIGARRRTKQGIGRFKIPARGSND